MQTQQQTQAGPQALQLPELEQLHWRLGFDDSETPTAITQRPTVVILTVLSVLGYEIGNVERLEYSKARCLHSALERSFEERKGGL